MLGKQTMIGKDTKKLLMFSCVFSTYLVVGALIFQALEMNNENKQKLIEETRRILNERYNISTDDWRKLELIAKDRLNVNATVWSFGNAFIFAGSVITTVGYGNIVPRTTNGRAFCIVYALLGIPLTCLTLKIIGEKLLAVITSVMKKVKTRLVRSDVKTVRKESVFLLNLFVWITTLVSLSGLAIWRRGWTWFESFYFCFITFSTIGFGDFVAFGENEANSAADYLIVFIGIVLGFAVTSTAFFSLASLMDEPLGRRARNETLITALNTLKQRLKSKRKTEAVRNVGNNQEENVIVNLDERTPKAQENVEKVQSFNENH